MIASVAAENLQRQEKLSQEKNEKRYPKNVSANKKFDEFRKVNPKK